MEIYNIRKKVQDANKYKLNAEQVPILEPEVQLKIYCKNCNAKVDEDEQATDNCNTVEILGFN